MKLKIGTGKSYMIFFNVEIVTNNISPLICMWFQKKIWHPETGVDLGFNINYASKIDNIESCVVGK